MSMMSLELTGTIGPEPKRHKIRQFIEAAKQYAQTKNESLAITINRLLQALSVTIDLSTFDPNNGVVCEFLVSLHELMSNIEQRSSMSSIAWNCVEVLSNACRNPATRNVLIHTYQFLSPLARLLGDQLTHEKKVKLLGLMQELTCGIKISWQIPHLPHLMTTLTKWVESGDEKIVTLSLGVLVNLCYKNLPAIYTLTRCIDMKQFVRICMPLQGTQIEVHVCKLLIILDYLNGKVPEDTILKLIKVTFKTMVEAFNTSDSILLKHIVEFFLDVMKQGSQAEIVAGYRSYDVEVEKLLDGIESNPTPTGDNPRTYDPECMALLFQFLHTLLELKHSDLSPLLPRILRIALKWIQTDIACTQALSVLRTIAVNTPSHSNSILEPLQSGLPVFVMLLKSEDSSSGNLERQQRAGALLQLLRALLKVEGLREKLVAELEEVTVLRVFAPVLEGSAVLGEESVYTAEAVDLYAYALALVDDLAKVQPAWIRLYCDLMQRRQIHMILAQALYNGPKLVKKAVMGMTASRNFPMDMVTDAMCDIQNVATRTETLAKSNELTAMCFPIMSVAKVERLDEVIAELKEAIAQTNVASISTSNVMELYEFKLAAMGHAERAAMASVEAASQRCVCLQHRTAQLTAELSRLHQLLFHTQQCLEEAVKKKDSLVDNNRELECRLDTERGKLKVCASQLKIKEGALAEAQRALEETRRGLEEETAARRTLEEKYGELKRVLEKLEENLIRKEKFAERKVEELTRANSAVESLTAQKTELEKRVGDMENELFATNRELEEVSRELESKRKIISMITQVATSDSK